MRGSRRKSATAKPPERTPVASGTASGDRYESNSAAPLIFWSISSKAKPGRPPTLHYRALLDSLAVAQRNAKAGADDLVVGLYALCAVLRFLEDPLVDRDDLARPLKVLTNVLRDVTLGAKPEVIFARKEKPNGAPKNLSSHTATAVMAACVDAHIAIGESREAAARSVARAANLVGLKIRGRPVAPKRLLRYRDEMNSGRGPPVAQETFAEYRELRGQRISLTGDISIDRQRTEMFVEFCLHGVRSAGF
jgi:hypothetical protein